ncbi:hypothetical protein [Streptomyces sp. N50]|uniref:hypothetical protein n=1 Tax=Streptomyces sp. N50 TaxID=3081765 RepID=UPI002962204F|nr:hypothetical protein [Streptomyces sp. N50]WOX10143.1 hypothetical protein R2B38_15335 [Streptomyces sp. N50]
MRNIHYFWRHPLAEQMREEGRQEGRQEGRAQARAEIVLRILGRRQIDVPDPVRDRILASTDLDELGTWFDRSHEVADARELFTEGS